MTVSVPHYATFNTPVDDDSCTRRGSGRVAAAGEGRTANRGRFITPSKILLVFLLLLYISQSFYKAVNEKKKKKISHRQLGPLRGSSSPFQHFEPARVKPN